MTNLDSAPLVVVVDQDVRRRRAAAVTLAAGGFEVLEAGTALQGLACWRAADADAVVLELDLRDAGDVLTTVATADPRQPRTPVITTSTDPSVERVVAALRAGAWDHLRTPYDPLELLARVGANVKLAAEHERLRQRTAELEYLGSVDDVTGLANRRQIEDDLGREAAAAARHHHALSAVLVGIDGWDAHTAAGLSASNDVLREMAVLIRAICRTGDLAGRWGDSQFLVVLPMTDGDGAKVFAERLRAVVNAAPVLTDAGPRAVSLSAGCATGAPGAAELLERARDALLAAQAAGGDTLAAICS